MKKISVYSWLWLAVFTSMLLLLPIYYQGFLSPKVCFYLLLVFSFFSLLLGYKNKGAFASFYQSLSRQKKFLLLIFFLILLILPLYLGSLLKALGQEHALFLGSWPGYISGNLLYFLCLSIFLDKEKVFIQKGERG